MGLKIGKKIKELRKKRGLTATELARLSGVQSATISRIENFKMVGTIESHEKIAYILGVELSDLYKGVKPETDNKVVVSKTTEFIHNQDTLVRCLISDALPKKMMPVLYEIKPGGKMSEQIDKVGSEKFVFLLDGKIEVTYDNKSYMLSKNETIYFNSSEMYSFANKGKKTAKVLSITSSPLVLKTQML